MHKLTKKYSTKGKVLPSREGEALSLPMGVQASAKDPGLGVGGRALIETASCLGGSNSPSGIFQFPCF